MRIAPTSAALAVGVPVRLGAFGGTAPYVWSKTEGVGSVNASTGVYSSSVLGSATIKATDSLGATETIQISVLTPLELVCDILQTQLGLEEGFVYLWNQKIKAPTTSGLFVAVSVLNSKPFGNRTSINSEGDEVQTCQSNDLIGIELISRDSSARDRRLDAILALQSYYAQRQQEQNGFSIGRLPASGFSSINVEDGAAIPYHFSLTLNLKYTVTKTNTDAAYYDSSTDEPEVVADP